MAEKDQFRADASVYRDKLAKQRTISENLRAADRSRDEEYNKGVDASLEDVWKPPADRSNYSQSRLSFAPRASPPRRQRVDQQLDAEQKDNHPIRNVEDDRLMVFADRIANSLDASAALNRETTKSMLSMFSDAQDRLNKTIVLVILVDKSGLGIVRRRI